MINYSQWVSDNPSTAVGRDTYGFLHQEEVDELPNAVTTCNRLPSLQTMTGLPAGMEKRSAIPMELASIRRERPTYLGCEIAAEAEDNGNLAEGRGRIYTKGELQHAGRELKGKRVDVDGKDDCFE